MIHRDKWKWYGTAGHFICSEWCRFHMLTKVGKYLISSIGEYVPDAPVREIHAQTKGITLEGWGDERIHDYMKKVGYQPLGAGPHPYQTLVFKAGAPCKAALCGKCGVPFPSDYSEIDGRRWMTAKEATDGHYKLCDKWSKK